MNLTKQPWLSYASDLHIELEQCQGEGKDTSGLAKQVAAIQALPMEDPQREAEAIRLLDETRRLPIRDDYPYKEPSDLPGIRRLRPDGPRRIETSIDASDLYDRIYGAWLGRCAGCLLGKPVEGWMRDRLVGFTRAISNYPIQNYMSSGHPDNIRKRFEVSDSSEEYFYDGPVPWINNIDCAPEDDDTNYTVICLLLLEENGPAFTSLDVATAWLTRLPLLKLCTAERIAYRNLSNLILPLDSAMHRNVYREWIGAQIRGDIFGYVNPGRIELAAEMAWRDAAISHVKNGIYGEMWVAAMLSAAYISDDPNEIVQIGLSEIPSKSRLAKAIEEVLSWPGRGISWEQALDRIHQRWDERNFHHWAHTISNAMIVAAGLLYG